jgi:hypothetical protein
LLVQLLLLLLLLLLVVVVVVVVGWVLLLHVHVLLQLLILLHRLQRRRSAVRWRLVRRLPASLPTRGRGRRRRRRRRRQRRRRRWRRRRRRWRCPSVLLPGELPQLQGGGAGATLLRRLLRLLPGAAGADSAGADSVQQRCQRGKLPHHGARRPHHGARPDAGGARGAGRIPNRRCLVLRFQPLCLVRLVVRTLQ